MRLRFDGRWAWLTALFVAPALAQPLPERVALCTACHGEGGNSALAGTPSLAGQPAIFTENQLVLFREGVRKAVPAKEAAVQGANDAEIRALARYYAAQKPAAPVGRRDPAMAVRGRQLVGKLYCGNCHMPDYKGREQMPRLAGQREEYLLEAMRAYKEYRRTGGDTIMAAALYGLADADLKALANYLAHTR